MTQIIILWTLSRNFVLDPKKLSVIKKFLMKLRLSPIILNAFSAKTTRIQRLSIAARLMRLSTAGFVLTNTKVTMTLF